MAQSTPGGGAGTADVPLRDRIDAGMVGRLIASQFPRWAHLPIEPVEPGGWDNRTFTLGHELMVRLPSDEFYAPQVPKEQRWLGYLAPRLPLPIPVPVAKGAPGGDYPYEWSVYPWLGGETARIDRIADLTRFAADLGSFLVALQGVDARGGPAAGLHSAYRGAPPEHYAAETWRAIETLGDEIPTAAVVAVWEAATASTWGRPPVWFHGDVAYGNLLVDHGRLSAVIDFGCAGVGDPACDLVIAWTFFSGASRETFRAAVAPDAGTWARGRGWALWKALITLPDFLTEGDEAGAAQARRDIDAVIADHRRFG